MNERYFSDCPELSSIGKWKMISSHVSFKDHKSILNVHLEANGLSKWLVGCDEVHAFDAHKLSKKYDLVVLYDILDHMPTSDDARRLIGECRRITRPAGKIFALCHPRISRLGTHLLSINKAYAHLFYELWGVHTLHFDDPVGFYRQCFLESGLKIAEERLYREYIEEFFMKVPDGTTKRPNIGPHHETQFATYTVEPEIPCFT